jgi:hypothetical protein
MLRRIPALGAALLVVVAAAGCGLAPAGTAASGSASPSPSPVPAGTRSATLVVAPPAGFSTDGSSCSDPLHIAIKLVAS